VEDQQREEQFKQTHSRDRDGRYTVSLPFKRNPVQLRVSKPKAVRMLARAFDKFEVDQTFTDVIISVNT